MIACKNSFSQICLADDRGQMAVVIELCKKHLQTFPNHGPAWLRYGMALVALARYPEAEKAIRRALKLCNKENLSYPYLQMGNLLEARGDYKRAAIWYKKAANQKSYDATFHIYLGHNAFKCRLPNQSEKHYQRALKCSEGPLEEAWFNLGGILLGKGKYADAIKCYENALQIDPKYKIAKDRLEDAKLALLITSSK